VASAGFAAADVSLSGSAEMGIVGGSDRDTQFLTDVDVTFTMSGETDNGLTFGASIDLDESDGDPSDAFGEFDQGGETIFISGGPHTFTMGDTDGAFDRAVDEVPVGGDIDSVVEHAGYSGNSGLDGLFGGQIARYDYAFDAFEFSFSVELCDGCEDTTDPDLDLSVSPVYGLGASYEFGDFDFGAGYRWVSASADDATEEGDFDASIMGISGGYTFGDLTIGANYSVASWEFDTTPADPDEFDVDITRVGLGAAYAMDAWTFAANWGQQEFDVEGADEDFTNSGYGLAIHYNLGGGAVIQFGYAHNSTDAGVTVDFNADDLEDVVTATTEDDSFSEWSFGVSMSF
jgi:outer membrane protein OmpU